MSMDPTAKSKEELERENLVFRQRLMNRGNEILAGDSTTEEPAGEDDTTMAVDQGTESRSTIPLMTKIPLKVKERIWSFQFVDFTELLPEAFKLAPTPIVLFKNSDEHSF